MILPKRSNSKLTTQTGQYILNNYPKLSSNQLSTILNLSGKTILRFLELNKIKRLKTSSNRTPPNFKWTKNLIKQEALKYNNKRSFELNSGGAYSAMVKLGIINHICKHMIPQGSIYKKHVYIYQFSDNSVYVGITQNLKQRHLQHTKKLLINKKVINYKTTKLYPAKKALKLEQKYVNLFKKHGYKVHNSTKCTQLGGSKIKWNLETCKNDALNYKTKNEWLKNSPSTYVISCRNKWHKECTKHMCDVRLTKIKNITTGEIFNSIKDACLKYNTYHTLIGSAIRNKYKAKNCYWEYVK